MPDDHQPVTRLLEACRGGDSAAAEQLFPLVYEELRRLARKHLANERPGHTLAPTALVHEAYLRLVDVEVPWQDRTHFFAVAASMLRRILVDHAKGRLREKRGGSAQKVSLDETIFITADPDPRIILIDEALNKLARIDERRSKIVELLFFGGLTFDEVSTVMDVSLSTLRREVNFAKAWIWREISSGEAEE